MGSAIAGWVGVGTYYSSNLSFQWRFPIALSCLPPLALLLVSPWIPESPRWRKSARVRVPSEMLIGSVLTRDRREEAWAIVSRLHGDATSEDGLTYAREEFHQMVQQVQVDASAWAQGGNRQLFTKPSYCKRMWMGFFIQYAAQSTGAQVIYGESATTATSSTTCRKHANLAYRSIHYRSVPKSWIERWDSLDTRGCVRESRYSVKPRGSSAPG